MSALLDIKGLQVRYSGFQAVRELDLSISAGETVALVGESGCGKSTSALAIMGLLPPEAQVSGAALFEGQDLLSLPPERLRALRGGTIAMIFQDSMTSLNPVLTIGRQIVEVLEIHTELRGRQAGALQGVQHGLHEIGLVKLQGRHVHGHAHRRQTCLQPAHRLLAGLLQHPCAQHRDEANVFSHRNEAGRWLPAQAGAVPAHQCFGTGNPPRDHVDLRLVMHLEPASLHRFVQILLQGHALL